MIDNKDSKKRYRAVVLVEDFAEKHADKPEVQAVTAEILADMEKAIEQNA
jgi:glycyl-tRNA synthetase (class II)